MSCMPLHNCFYITSVLPRNTCVFWLIFYFWRVFLKTKRKKSNNNKKKALNVSVILFQCVKANPKDVVVAHS